MGEKGRHGFCGIQRRYLSSWIGDTFVFENRLKKEDDFIFEVYEFDWMTTESKPAWNELIGYVKELVFELLRFIFTNMWPNCKIGLMYIII